MMSRTSASQLTSREVRRVGLISWCRIGARGAIWRADGGRFHSGYPAGGERKVHGNVVLTQITEMTQMTYVFYFYFRKTGPQERAEAERGARSATPGAGVLLEQGNPTQSYLIAPNPNSEAGWGTHPPWEPFRQTEFGRPRGKLRAHRKVPGGRVSDARKSGTRGAFRYTRGRVCSPSRGIRPNRTQSYRRRIMRICL